MVMHPSDLPPTQQQSQLQIYGGGFNFFGYFHPDLCGDDTI